MPSLFKPNSKRNNPYSNPNHPSHTALPPKVINPHSASQPNVATQSATLPPSNNLLAEARQLANRDPITGRLLPRPSMPTDTASETNLLANARLHRAMNAVDRLGPSAERSAYLGRASQTALVCGKRYDLVSAEQRKKREEEEKLKKVMGGVEFYAPERKVGEFYGGGVED
ncbi:hypothetical protein CC86DRAFT_368413 [Ophiobolus disseminans]|uniref:Uncharacterized protein n=1 Tax=Ophiobolus disseminans TaxID=1469910 RepID=A0A6A7A9V9_9PLEO|nr:hypothetical protein CC86DRAFT_368413 [Ophiobolus disseminans]